MMSTDSLFSAFLTQNKDCRYGTGQRRRQYTEIRLMRHHPVLPEMFRCEDDDIGRCRMKWNGLHLGRWLGFMSQQILLKPSITVLPSIVPTFAISVVGAPVGRPRGRERQGRGDPFAAVGLVQRGGEVGQRGRELHEHVGRQPGHHRSSSVQQRPLLAQLTSPSPSSSSLS